MSTISCNPHECPKSACPLRSRVLKRDLAGAALGLTNRAIAKIRWVSSDAVDMSMQTIRGRLGVANIKAALTRAFVCGCLPIDYEELERILNDEKS